MVFFTKTYKSGYSKALSRTEIRYIALNTVFMSLHKAISLKWSLMAVLSKTATRQSFLNIMATFLHNISTFGNCPRQSHPLSKHLLAPTPYTVLLIDIRVSTGDSGTYYMVEQQRLRQKPFSRFCKQLSTFGQSPLENSFPTFVSQ